MADSSDVIDRVCRQVNDKARTVPPCFHFRKGLTFDLPDDRTERRKRLVEFAALCVAKAAELDYA